MSHFCGLVILTPEYAKFNSMKDSLAKYDENIVYPEYRKRDLSENEKVDFLEYYLINRSEADDAAFIRANYTKFLLGFPKLVRNRKNYVKFDDYATKRYGDNKNNINKQVLKKNWAIYLASKFKDKYVEYFKQNYPDMLAKFEETYKEHGDDWNGNQWRKDENGVWAIYSTYNPNSKWDWYTEGGRWSKSIKTKSGEFVDSCLFGEIDFEPYPDDAYEDATDLWGKPYKKLKDGYEYHYTKDDIPFCVIIDGIWYERGEMGWWACVSNEKDSKEWNNEVENLFANIPADSMVYNVDFHI
jgi:hypothetical protein